MEFASTIITKYIYNKISLHRLSIQRPKIKQNHNLRLEKLCEQVFLGYDGGK